MVAKARLEVAFDVDPGTDPAPADWTDLDGRIRERDPVTSTVDSQRATARVTLDNRDGALNPINPAATLNLVPMRHARLLADIGGSPVDVWRGYVGQWPPSWRPNDETIDVQLVDARVWLARQQADVDLPAQMSHERITALLDLAGWPAGLRAIGDGQVRMEAVEQEGASPWRLMLDVVDAEQGWLWPAPDGDITFRGRHSRLSVSSQLTVGGANVRVAQATSSWDADRIVNVARVELSNGDDFTIEDVPSQDAFGEMSESFRDLPVPWYEANGLADWTVHRYADPHFALPTIDLNVIDDAELTNVLALRVGDLVTFEHTPPWGAMSEVGHIESIQHRSAHGVWRTSLALTPYFGEGPWMEWLADGDETTDGGTWLSDSATEGAAWAP